MTAVRFERAAVRDWAFPRAAAGVRLLVDHAREHGMAEPEVLAGSGLTADGLATATEVTAAQELRVVRNLRRRLGEVGDQVGRRYRATTFGVLGYALVSSHTLLDAMNVALRFLDLSHTFAIPSAAVDGERVRIVVSGADLPGDVRGFLVDRDAAAIRAVLREIGPEGVTTTSAREGDAVVVSLPEITA